MSISEARFFLVATGEGRGRRLVEATWYSTAVS
jgi:hypothetical protein